MASAKSTISLPLDDTGNGKVINRYFDNLEAAVPQELAAPYTEANAVYELTEDATIDGGNYTLTFDLGGLGSFTTANILHSANAATIEGAIDTAATAASIVGWTNGDISVSGGPASTAAVVFTFDGASVAGMNFASDAVSVTDVDLTTGTLTTVTRTTIGHPAAPVTQLLATQGWINLVGGIGNAPTWTLNPNVPKPERCVAEFVARAVADELEYEAAYDRILVLSNYDRPVQARSNLVV